MATLQDITMAEEVVKTTSFQFLLDEDWTNNVFVAACIAGRLRLVKEMIDRGQVVDELFTERYHGKDSIIERQWTVLFKICYEYSRPDCIAMARLLIENGANVNFTNSKLWTPLLVAGRRAEIGGIRTEIGMAQLLVENGADVNAANENQETPFWNACCRTNLPLARLLIDHGANIHVNVDVIHWEFSALEFVNIHSLGVSALECVEDPVDRAALELYATPREKNWRRRKFFAFFLQSLKLWPRSEPQWAQQRVLAEMGDLQRLIGSFL